MKLTSSAFADGSAIPAQYGCSGASEKPPLAIAGVPANAKSLALIVDDPDAPGGHFTHWVVWNIPPNSTTVQGVEGENGYGKTGWGPPCPPSGEHRYRFDLYALDRTVKDRADLDTAIARDAIAKSELTGRYKR